MTLPTNSPYSAGQFLDVSRNGKRHLIWPGHLVTWTVTVAGAVATGDWSYKIDGTLVEYPAVVGPDTIATIALGLATKHVGSTESYRKANATVAAGVITVQARTTDDTFTITDTVGVTGTLTALDITVADVDLPLGVAVAKAADGSMRMLAPGDTAASMIGIVGAAPGSELKANTGAVGDFDVYETGSLVDYLDKGEIPVGVEMDIAIGDPVWVRHTATGAEVFGAFRNAVDGADTFQLTNARWSEASWLDHDGRKTAMVIINQP